MDDNQLKQIIKQLDKSIIKDGAVVRFDIYGGGPDEGFIQANQKGYLRLGVEFLKAAYAPKVKEKDKNEHMINAEIYYLTGEESPINFDWFERKENISPPTASIKPGGFKDAVFLFGCAITLFIVIFVFVMGIIAIIGMFK